MWTQSKIYSMCNNFTFDPSQDQVQIFVCIYANFTHIQILPKVKFAYMQKIINYIITLYKCWFDVVSTLYVFQDYSVWLAFISFIHLLTFSIVANLYAFLS